MKQDWGAALRCAGLAAITSIPFLAPGTATATDMPLDAFQGCKQQTSAPGAKPAPQSPREKIKQRSFASMPVMEAMANADDQFDGACWFRVDGVWTDDETIVLNRAAFAPGWASDTPELLSLANGTYKRQAHLIIAPSEDSNKTLTVIDAFDPERVTVFNSKDNTPLDKVLRRNGPKKTYYAAAPSYHGQSLVIDVTRSGLARLKVNGKTYYRPKPAQSASEIALDINPDDAFYMNSGLENLRAIRQGYDIAAIDPFYLLSSDKKAIFVDTGAYYVEEKRVLPIGVRFLQEASQGMVYRKEMMTNSSQLQSTYVGNIGGEIGGSKKGVYEASTAVDYTVEQTANFQAGKTSAQAVGYSRHKQYALALNYSYSTLSNRFVDIVSDAAAALKKDPKTAKPYLDAIIQNFGTHYANAVTYGASAKMTKTFTEETYAEEFGGSEKLGFESTAKLFGAGGSMHSSTMNGQKTGVSGSMGSEGASFVAVGGNGSWDQNGYSAGSTPYPILLDLRPIYELLNPINFPGEIFMYQNTRRALEQAVDRYLAGKRKSLPSTNFAPDVNIYGTYFSPDSTGSKWTFKMKGANTLLVRTVYNGKTSPEIAFKRNTPHNFFFSLGGDKFMQYRQTKTGVVRLKDDRADKPFWLYPADKPMFPDQVDITGTYFSEKNAKNKITFKMDNQNRLAMRRDWSDDKSLSYYNRSSATEFSSKNTLFRVIGPGRIGAYHRPTKKWSYHLLADKARYPNSKNISGTFVGLANPKNSMKFQVVNPNLVYAWPSWVDGGKKREAWYRSGPNSYGVFGVQNSWTLNPDGSITLHSVKSDKKFNFVKGTPGKLKEGAVPAMGIVFK